MQTYIVVTDTGTRFTYRAMGIGHAAEIYFATDGDDAGEGTAPLLAGVYVDGNPYVGAI